MPLLPRQVRRDAEEGQPAVLDVPSRPDLATRDSPSIPEGVFIIITFIRQARVVPPSYGSGPGEGQPPTHRPREELAREDTE